MKTKKTISFMLAFAIIALFTFSSAVVQANDLKHVPAYELKVIPSVTVDLIKGIALSPNSGKVEGSLIATLTNAIGYEGDIYWGAGQFCTYYLAPNGKISFNKDVPIAFETYEGRKVIEVKKEILKAGVTYNIYDIAGGIISVGENYKIVDYDVGLMDASEALDFSDGESDIVHTGIEIRFGILYGQDDYYYDDNDEPSHNIWLVSILNVATSPAVYDVKKVERTIYDDSGKAVMTVFDVLDVAKETVTYEGRQFETDVYIVPATGATVIFKDAAKGDEAKITNRENRSDEAEAQMRKIRSYPQGYFAVDWWITKADRANPNCSYDHISFVEYRGGMVVITFANPNNKPVTVTAVSSPSKVIVDGKEVAFNAYNIGGSNYFKLRDLAYVLNGTQKQFEVGFDEGKNAISLTKGKPYTALGSEMTGKGAGDKTATPTTSKIYLDGKEVQFTAYNIGGNNYFKLRDVMETFDVYVGYDDATKTITLDTSKGYNYTPELPKEIIVLTKQEFYLKDVNNRYYRENRDLICTVTSEYDKDGYLVLQKRILAWDPEKPDTYIDEIERTANARRGYRRHHSFYFANGFEEATLLRLTNGNYKSIEPSRKVENLNPESAATGGNSIGGEGWKYAEFEYDKDGNTVKINSYGAARNLIGYCLLEYGVLELQPDGTYLMK